MSLVSINAFAGTCVGAGIWSQDRDEKFFSWKALVAECVLTQPKSVGKISSVISMVILVVQIRRCLQSMEDKFY